MVTSLYQAVTLSFLGCDVTGAQHPILTLESRSSCWLFQQFVPLSSCLKLQPLSAWKPETALITLWEETNGWVNHSSLILNIWFWCEKSSLEIQTNPVLWRWRMLQLPSLFYICSTLRQDRTAALPHREELCSPLAHMRSEDVQQTELQWRTSSSRQGSRE